MTPESTPQGIDYALRMSIEKDRAVAACVTLPRSTQHFVHLLLRLT